VLHTLSEANALVLSEYAVLLSEEAVITLYCLLYNNTFTVFLRGLKIRAESTFTSVSKLLKREVFNKVFGTNLFYSPILHEHPMYLL